MRTATASAEPARWQRGSILLGAAWFVSTLTVRLPVTARGVSLGYLAGTALMGLALAAMLWRRRPQLREAARQHLPAAVAARLLLGAHLLGALLAPATRPGLWLTVRLAGVLSFGLVFLIAGRQPGLRQALATAGATLVLLEATLLLLALAGWPAIDGW